MTEDEARNWLAETFSPSAAVRLALEQYVAAIIVENDAQNLISAASVDHIWARHIVDCAQLVHLAIQNHAPAGHWVDIGSGAGLPGIVVALLVDRPVALVEPRRKRAEFLRHCCATLALERQVTVHHCTAERVFGLSAAILSARAVASFGDVLSMGAALSTAETLWLLPKGQKADKELREQRREVRRGFHVERSVTDSNAGILVGTLGRRR